MWCITPAGPARLKIRIRRGMTMLLQANLEMFRFNLLLIIGAVILLGVALIVFIAFWTAINSAIWLARRRLAERAYLEQTFRADGQRYPAFMEGACNECHRGDRKIYYPQGTDKELCPRCYERYWRREAAALKPDSIVDATGSPALGT